MVQRSSESHTVHLKYCWQFSSRAKAIGPLSRPATNTAAGAATSTKHRSTKNFIFFSQSSAVAEGPRAFELASNYRGRSWARCGGSVNSWPQPRCIARVLLVSKDVNTALHAAASPTERDDVPNSGKFAARQRSEACRRNRFHMRDK